jgi:hypothetical protein
VVAPDDGFPQLPAQVRASDADRDRVIEELGDRYAEGRLSQDTFAARVDAALRARRQGDLAGLVADLPGAPRPRRPLRSVVARAWRRSVDAVDRWTRKAPTPLVLPAGPQLRFTIGREPACDMTLADITVSRWHASLSRADGSWLIDDLGSTNGTRVNGWRVTAPTPIGPGDRVTFGAALFVIQGGADPARSLGRAVAPG